MDNKENYKQDAIRQVDPAQKNKNILTCIKLAKAGYYLNDHEYKKNRIDDLE